MNIGLVIVLHDSESDTEITEVKAELSGLKNCFQNNHNTLFRERNLKIFLGRGTAPPHWGGKNPSPDPTPRGAYGASIVAPSALGFMRPVFSVPIVGNPS